MLEETPLQTIRERRDALPESPLPTFDPRTVLARALREEAWLEWKDRALVMVKTERIRVVWRALHAGSALPTHKADGPITMLVLKYPTSVTLAVKGTTLPRLSGQLESFPKFHFFELHIKMFTKRPELVGWGGKRSDVAERGSALGAAILLRNVECCG